MALSHSICIAVWERSLAAEIGIAVPILPPDARPNALAKFYEARKVDASGRFDNIAIMQPNNGELWFCKKDTRL